MALLKTSDGKYITIDGKVLDIPQASEDSSDALKNTIANSHTHSNKKILDSITSDTLNKITDSASKAHSHITSGHANQVIYYDGSTIGIGPSANVTINNGGINTDKLFVGSQSYGNTLPTSGEQGQVFFKFV